MTNGFQDPHFLYEKQSLSSSFFCVPAAGNIFPAPAPSEDGYRRRVYKIFQIMTSIKDAEMSHCTKVRERVI